MEMENKMKNEEKSNGKLLHVPLGKDIQDKKNIILEFEFTKDDHEKTMDEEKREFIYSDMYEKAISKREFVLMFPARLSDFTADKRRFGLKKYKEYSFQVSFENSVTCNINEHIKSEIVDLINYINHRHLIRNFKGLETLETYKKSINMLVNLFEEADKLSE